MKQVSGCPLLDWLVNHGTPREQLAYRWLEENFGEIPESIGGETLETIPFGDLRRSGTDHHESRWRCAMTRSSSWTPQSR